MKILRYLFIVALSLLNFACSPTQELKDGVSFVGLNKVYIEKPVGGFEVFGGNSSKNWADDVIVEKFKEYMKSKSYICVANKDEAQVIFVPLWSTSSKANENFVNRADKPINSMNSPLTTYITLEIQAYLKDRADWVWRGFAPNQISKNSITEASLGNQVEWCMQEFPPEEYPSNLEERKSQIKERKENSQLNPMGESPLSSK